MSNEVKIYPIENSWIVEWHQYMIVKKEAYPTFVDVIERLKILLDVDCTESAFRQ